MANNNVVIGVARDEKVKDYCIENRGCFFSQFILVSNGVLPSRFYLHGKVERRAIGRIGNKLYYIESHNKEALWAFADALREYGFIDAIYITSGTDYCYYRSADGRLHDIGDANKRARSIRDKEPYLGWYSKKDKHLLPFTHAQVTTTTSLSNLQLRQMVDKYLGMACIPNECSPIAQCNFCSCLAVSCTKEAAPIGF